MEQIYAAIGAALIALIGTWTVITGTFFLWKKKKLSKLLTKAEKFHYEYITATADIRSFWFFGRNNVKMQEDFNKSTQLTSNLFNYYYQFKMYLDNIRTYSSDKNINNLCKKIANDTKEEYINICNNLRDCCFWYNDIEYRMSDEMGKIKEKAEKSLAKLFDEEKYNKESKVDLEKIRTINKEQCLISYRIITNLWDYFKYYGNKKIW